MSISYLHVEVYQPNKKPLREEGTCPLVKGIGSRPPASLVTILTDSAWGTFPTSISFTPI